MVDSIDSCIMLYSYSGFPERGWNLLQTKQLVAEDVDVTEATSLAAPSPQVDILDSVNALSSDGSSKDVSSTTPDEISKVDSVQKDSPETLKAPSVKQIAAAESPTELQKHFANKHHTMSNLSIILTLVSILVRVSCISQHIILIDEGDLGCI